MSLETTATQVLDWTSGVAALAWSHSLTVLRDDSRDLRGDAQFADLSTIGAGTLDAMTGDMSKTMMTKKQIRSVVRSDGRTALIAVDADAYEDEDDCLAAAAADYVADHPESAGYDMAPRWEDNSRERILLDVPADA